MSQYIIEDLKDKLEEMPIAARVDLVDFNAIDQSFVDIALRGGVEIWKRRKKNSLFS